MKIIIEVSDELDMKTIMEYAKCINIDEQFIEKVSFEK